MTFATATAVVVARALLRGLYIVAKWFLFGENPTRRRLPLPPSALLQLHRRLHHSSWNGKWNGWGLGEWEWEWGDSVWRGGRVLSMAVERGRVVHGNGNWSDVSSFYAALCVTLPEFLDKTRLMVVTRRRWQQRQREDVYLYMEKVPPSLLKSVCMCVCVC